VAGVSDNGERRRALLRRAHLYLILEASGHGNTLDLVGRALDGGVDMVQLRDKHADDERLVTTGRALADLCVRSGTLFCVNDRPEVALACGADAVHVGQEDEPVASVRRTVGLELLIGLSTHTPEQFDAGLLSGADYLSAGPVHATPTKPGRPATGLELVAHAAAAGAKTPFFAIGGIDVATAPAVLDSGATRIAVVRAIRDARDPGAAAAELRALLDRQAAGVGAT
jgi:thiamine-phosphate pyrophosphorylase